MSDAPISDKEYQQAAPIPRLSRTSPSMVSAVSARDGFTPYSRQIVQPASVTELCVVWHAVSVSSSPASVNAPVSLGTVLVTLCGPPCVE